MYFLILFKKEKHPFRKASVNTRFKLFSPNEILQEFSSVMVVSYQDIYTRDNFYTLK